jgi:hypothetical protein
MDGERWRGGHGHEGSTHVVLPPPCWSATKVWQSIHEYRIVTSTRILQRPVPHLRLVLIAGQHPFLAKGAPPQRVRPLASPLGPVSCHVHLSAGHHYFLPRTDQPGALRRYAADRQGPQQHLCSLPGGGASLLPATPCPLIERVPRDHPSAMNSITTREVRRHHLRAPCAARH